MSAFPLFKLGSLFIKQISKPLSKLLKDKALTQPKLKNYVLIPSAQLYHWMDVKIRMNLLGLPGKVEPLTEKAAVQLGSDLLSDFIVFGTALGIIMFEYYRQTRNSAKKEASIENKVGVIEFNKALLHENVENQTKSIEEINNMIQTNRSEIDILNKRIRRMEKRLNGESVLLDDIKEELTNKMDLLVTPVVKTLKKATPDALTGHINTLNDAFTKKSIINDSVNDAIKIMTNKQFY